MMFTRHASSSGQSSPSQPTMNFSQTFNQPEASMSVSTFPQASNNWFPPNSAGIDSDLDINLGNNPGMFDNNFKFD